MCCIYLQLYVLYYAVLVATYVTCDFYYKTETQHTHPVVIISLDSLYEGPGVGST